MYGAPQGLQVDLLDLADQPVLLAIQVAAVERAVLQAAGADSPRLQRVHQAHAELVHHRAHHRHDFLGGHPQAIDALAFHAGFFERRVHLGASAVQYHRAQPQAVQEGQRRGQFVQVVPEDAAAHLDHGESGLLDRGELLQVLTGFPA